MFQWWNDFSAQAQTKLAQWNNSTFKDGCMAVCALIAAADGKVDATERTKVAKLIAANELLQVFDGSELKNTFDAFCDKAGDEFARLDLLNVVRRLKGNDAQADTALKIALIIANADGDFADSEKVVVRELCGALGLAATEYLS